MTNIITKYGQLITATTTDLGNWLNGKNGFVFGCLVITEK
jgi:hypothetical protein